MKRIVITLAALTISSGAFAIGGGDSSENYGSALRNSAHPASNVVQKINTHKTKAFLGGDDSSYGSALADLDAPDRAKADVSVSNRGLDSDISVGDRWFMDNNEQF